MLNELYDLALSLERAGIVPTEWHPDLKELPSVTKVKPCFKVYLAQDGAIADIEPIENSAGTLLSCPRSLSLPLPCLAGHQQT